MRYIWLSHLGVYVCVASSWVETRDAVKRPTMDRTAPKTRNYPAPKVSPAEAENPWVRCFLPQNKSAVKLKMEMKVREGSDKNGRLNLEHVSFLHVHWT